MGQAHAGSHFGNRSVPGWMFTGEAMALIITRQLASFRSGREVACAAWMCAIVHVVDILPPSKGTHFLHEKCT